MLFEEQDLQKLNFHKIFLRAQKIKFTFQKFITVKKMTYKRNIYSI